MGYHNDYDEYFIYLLILSALHTLVIEILILAAVTEYLRQTLKFHIQDIFIR